MSTSAPPPYPPPGQPYQQAPAAPAKKPIFKKWWFWVGIIVLIVIIASAAGGGGDSNESSPAATTAPQAQQSDPASTGGAETSAAEPAPTTEAAPADDPLADGDWAASDIQIENSQFGTSMTARVTNTGSDSLSGLFTITVFDQGGARIANFQGSASDVEPGSASTVTFIGTTETLEGDASTYSYEFEDNGSY